ncbi:hypothetical protein BC834DRAFT_1040746 [Gloeopeniophorella convolvens]|nr:hypothetical protein BC834DRAFT_1040746 [Gloeopeniophorella convolvens]
MSCQRRPPALPHPPGARIASLALLFASASKAWAAPHSNLAPRDSNGGGGSSIGKILGPVLAVLAFVIVIPMVIYRKQLLSKMRHVSAHSMLGPRPAPPAAVRDLTAEDIAGPTAAGQAQTAATQRAERRARRTRRTPSQISTRSLPAYMKEPGEHELVIVQGSQDMEDAPLTAQVVMPPVREDEDEGSSNSHSRAHSRNVSQTSYVVIADDEHVETPLLERHDSHELNTHDRQATITRASPQAVNPSDSQGSSRSALLADGADSRNDGTPGPEDPRGEAPPYFEVIGDPAEARAASVDLTRIETTDTLPIAPDSPRTSHESPAARPRPAVAAADADQGTVRRRSMFRGLLDAASRALSPQNPVPVPPSSAAPRPSTTSRPSTSRPSRDTTTASPPPRPSNLSTRPGAARPANAGHRTTPSHGSVFSVASSAFSRTRSRSASNAAAAAAAALTSPSAISIASISAPLTHTAVRTDFVYPRSGPTPEQLKLISSVESVGKFGVPYGPDARAYHASASRVNLHGPPPGFEEAHGRASLDGLPATPDAAGRARSRSALGRNTPDAALHSPQASPLAASFAPASVRPATPAQDSPPAPLAIDTGVETAAAHDDDDDKAALRREREMEELASPAETLAPRAPSPTPTVGTVATVTRASAASSNSAAVSIPASAPRAGTRCDRRARAHPRARACTCTCACTHAQPITPSTAPTAFRMPATPLSGTRPGSRASSVATFRTAGSGPGGETETETETEAFTDAEVFTDAESGDETEAGETPPATPRVGPAPPPAHAGEPPATPSVASPTAQALLAEAATHRRKNGKDPRDVYEPHRGIVLNRADTQPSRSRQRAALDGAKTNHGAWTLVRVDTGIEVPVGGDDTDAGHGEVAERAQLLALPAGDATANPIGPSRRRTRPVVRVRMS